MLRYIFVFTLLLTAVFCYAQITVFADDFSTHQNTSWTTSGQIGSSAFSVNRSGVDWGTRRNTDPAQLELSNDASGATNAAGWVFASTSTGSFASPYNPTLKSTNGQISWYVNLRQVRTDPSGFGSGNYGVAFILAGSSTTANNSGTGYALALGQSGSTDPLRLVKYGAGITSFTNIITSNTSGLTDFGNEYLSVKVTYSPETDTWELFLRNDGTSGFSDPQSGTLVSQGTAVDGTYTSTALGYLGAYWQGSTGANQTAFFDNIAVQVTPNHTSYLTVQPLELSGFYYILNNGPSPQQHFSVSGSDLIQSITISPSEHYEISTSEGTGFVPANPITLAPVGGVVPATNIYVRLKSGLPAQDYQGENISVSTMGADTQNVVCGGSVLAPGITVSPASLSGFAYMYGLGPSGEQTFTVSGQNVYSDINIAAPAEFEISASPGSGFGASIVLSPTKSSIPATTIFVRLKAGLNVGEYFNRNITLSASGAADKTVSCSGSVTSGATPQAPTALAATDVSPTSFTANWTPVDNATSYRLDVFTGSDIEDLFISEYVEGSSNNKYLEVFNGSDSSIDLSDYRLQTYYNGSTTPSGNVQLSGTIASGACVVYQNSAAQLTLPPGVTAIVNYSVNFNGDDAVALYKISTDSFVDVFGRMGEDPGDYWGTPPNISKDQTLVRKASVSAGITQNPASGFPTLTTEWDFYPVDTATYLGSHSCARAISYVPGYQNLDVGNVSSYTVTGLAENTQYKYLVRAVNPYGTSVNSNTIEVTTTSSTAPAIYVYGTLNPFSTSEGTPSLAQSYTLSSANLSQNVSIAIPAGFELSVDGGNNYTAGAASVSPSFNGQVWVRLSGTSSGTYSGSLAHSSTGATTVYLAVNGVVTSENINAPTIQAHSITGYPAYTSISLEWSTGNGAYRVVKINTSNSFTAPADGSSPAANTFYTGAGEQVVYNGATEYLEGDPFNGCTVTNLTPNTVYWFRIYEYNGTGIDTRYLTTTASNNPKSISTTSSPGTGYYAGIYGYGTTIKGLLHDLLRTTHTTEYSYTAATTQLKYTDQDPNNPNNVIEIYTRWSIDADSYGGSASDWNKEHTWSKSHGGFGDNAPAGTDLHHLRPCDATVNSSKSNKDFDNGGTAVTDDSPPPGYTGATGCYQTYNTWEPRPEDKGDVARIIMYMAVRYEGTDTSYDLELVDHDYSDASQNLPYYGKLATLLQWHVADPPDAWEVRRNNRIAERQGNRNPFIDMPGYAARIWAPCPLFNTDVGTTSFTANWSVPITATRYYLQVATDSLFTNLVTAYSNLNVNLATSRSVTGLSAGGTYYYRLRPYFEDDYGMWSPYLQVVLDEPVTATAIITPSQTLEEINLAGSILTLTLSNATFTDATLLAANFTLNNAPAGLSVASVSYVNASTARITLGFNGMDFDQNYPNFSVTVNSAELSVPYNVTSNAITIHAHVEGTATLALEGSNLKLTITPVPGAVSYRVFGSTDPYGQYTDIGSAGVFDPAESNVWRIPQDYFTEPRHFFKVSAVL